MRAYVKVFPQDYFTVDYFPTVCLFVTKLGWSMPYVHPSKKVTQHDFNRLYQFVYGFVFIMLGIILKAWLFVFPLILHFVMFAFQERAQGDLIGFNVKK